MTALHHPVGPETLWSAWAWDPITLFLLVASGCLYARGLSRLRASRHRRARARRALAFYGGLLVVAVALLSPLHAAAEALLTAHMAQHLALMVVAAPLLVLGAPLVPSWLGLPRGARPPLRALRRRTSPWARRAMHPLLVTALHGAALWTWHLPAVYGAALEEPVLHALEHASFLGSALLFWAVVLPGGSERRAPFAALAVVFFTALHSGALGALITFATRPLYAAHVQPAVMWGIDPLTDQQLAGLVMWVPMGGLYLLTMAALLLRWLRAMEHEPRAGSFAQAGDRP